ncbi:MAG: hypothetical protein VZS44_04480 [Bacilli bacterium]|nr:hypothetical protein [Bacilli bacterium]
MSKNPLKLKKVLSLIFTYIAYGIICIYLIFMITFLFLCIYYIITGKDLTKKLSKYMSNKCEICEKNSEEYLESKKYFKKLTYTIPDSFEKKENCSCQTDYSYQKDDVICEFKVEYEGKTYNNSSSNTAQWYLGHNKANIEEIEINNYKWYKTEVEFQNKDTLYKNYSFISVYKKRAYYIEYIINDSSHGDNNICEVYYDNIISSLKFK